MFTYKVAEADSDSLIGSGDGLKIYHDTTQGRGVTWLRIDSTKQNRPIIIVLSDAVPQITEIVNALEEFLETPDVIHSESPGLAKFLYFIIGRKIIGASKATITREKTFSLPMARIYDTCRFVKLRGWFSPWINLEIFSHGNKSSHITRFPVTLSQCEEIYSILKNHLTDHSEVM